MSRGSFIKFDNEFVFPDPEPSIINMLYEWSRIYGHFGLCSVSIFFFHFYNHQS